MCCSDSAHGHRRSGHVDTSPYWADSVSMPGFPKLDDDLQVDVVVIGGGITGLTAAYLLTAAGKTVAVLERGRCAEVDTGHTTAHLTMVTDVRLPALVQRFGRDHAQAVWDAGLAAIAQIDDAVRTHRIDCGFEWVDGYLHAPAADATPTAGGRTARRGRSRGGPGLRRVVRGCGAAGQRPRHPDRGSGPRPSTQVPGGPGAAGRRAGRPDLRAERRRRVSRRAHGP